MKIEIVESVFYSGDHWFDGVRFDNYVIELEGHDSPYKMTKIYHPTHHRVLVGDKITCTIEDDRLKNVKVLNEIN
jgi:hypothetical protein